MKVLVIADADPGIDVVKTIKDEKIDIVITLGDLMGYELEGLETVDIPKIGVYGNHDGRRYMEYFGILDLNGRTCEVGGLTFGGLEGCVEYRGHVVEPMYSQEEARQILEGMPRVDVFVTHCPPRGINDEDDVAHQGWDGLRDYLDEKKPRVLLHGHTYPAEWKMVREYKDTRIEYVRGYRVIEI